MNHPATGLWKPPVFILVALSGCGMFGGGPKPNPVTVSGSAISTETVSLGNGYGLDLPKTIDGFTRTGTEDRPAGTDIVAGYARTVDPAPIIATIRVHKAGEASSLDLLAATPPAATTSKSQASLDASIKQVRRFYPDAEILSTAGAFLVRFGAMQNGRSALLSYVDSMDGVRQPILLRIETFCCADQKWNYEFRFRYPASLAGVDGPIAKFVDGIAWSRDPGESIDKPE